MAGQENGHMASWRGCGASLSGVAVKMMYHFPAMLWISGAHNFVESKPNKIPAW